MTVRAPTQGDLEGVLELLAASDLVDIGIPDTTLEDLREDWDRPGFALERDAWVVEENGRLVAYAWLWERDVGKPLAVGCVLPQARGCGIGSELVRLAEERAREKGASLLAEYAWSDTARRLLEGCRYHHARTYFRMAIDLVEEPPAPVWPPGVVLRPFGLGIDAAPVYEAMNDAFADEWGFTPEPFDRWRERHLGREEFDAGLWLIARDGEEIAGCALSGLYEDGAFIHGIGVRPPWRRRGLGRALLVASFGEFHRRGAGRVALSVDAANPTGATRLYERVGMRVLFRFDRYEKTLS